MPEEVMDSLGLFQYLAYPTIKVLQKGHATISETKATVATCMHGVTVNLCNHNPDLLLILILVAS